MTYRNNVKFIQKYTQSTTSTWTSLLFMTLYNTDILVFCLMLFWKCKGRVGCREVTLEADCISPETISRKGTLPDSQP